MKKSVLALGLLVLAGSMASAAAFAAEETQTAVSIGKVQEAQAVRVVSSQGFRVALVKPFLEADVKVDKYSNTSTIQNTNGFALGYASLPIRGLGWTTNFAYLDLRESMSNPPEIYLMRVDGNLGYAFNSVVSVKGGLNVSKMNGPNNISSLDAGLGGQVSMGLQMNRNLGLDIGLVAMQQTGSVPQVSGVNVMESGLELALTGTF